MRVKIRMVKNLRVKVAYLNLELLQMLPHETQQRLFNELELIRRVVK
jgi:hypothetical protein